MGRKSLKGTGGKKRCNVTEKTFASPIGRFRHDPETEVILQDLPNKSQFIREAIKEKSLVHQSASPLPDHSRQAVLADLLALHHVIIQAIEAQSRLLEELPSDIQDPLTPLLDTALALIDALQAAFWQPDDLVL
ncbi:MAG: hypothetical protein ACFFCZ_00985 [Promethearchaeota archaeon]